MLAGDRSTGVDAEIQDLQPSGFDSFGLVGIVDVEDDVRVQVPIAGMKEVGQTETMPLPDGFDPRKQLREHRARNDRVFDEDVRAQLPERAESALSGTPQPLSLRLR